MRDPADLLRHAAARHAAGALDEAEQLYRQVLRQRPGEPNALNLLGVLERQRGRPGAALEPIGRAVALRPNSAVFLANQGGALAECGRLPDAVAALRAALAIRPDDATALRNLGQALCALGQPGAALEPLERAAALQPDAPEPLLALAHAHREAGDPAAAGRAAEAALQLGSIPPALAEQARFVLAALRGDVPERAPAGYVRDLFDSFAPRFEAELTGALAYRTPALLAELLPRAGVVPDGSRDVLDLGCGTGLSGLALAPFARCLEGLDLSPRMLDAARRHGCYHALHEADLLDWLPAHPARFDLVAATDVLNYLGDLGPALRAIAGALRASGVAAFSVETGHGASVTLADTLRFRHDPDHVARLAAAAGLRESARNSVALRQEKGRPVPGTLFAFRRG